MFFEISIQVFFFHFPDPDGCLVTFHGIGRNPFMSTICNRDVKTHLWAPIGIRWAELSEPLLDKP